MDILTMGIIGGLILLAIIFAAAIVIFTVAIYNKLISMKNGIEGSFNQINVAMKKRFDMISSLVESTKSYLKFEKGTFEQITKYRSMNITTPDQAKEADTFAKSVLGAINVAVENYPNLKGSETVINLQNSIKGVEDEISRIRYLYNDQVQKYNITIEQFPTNLFAAIMGFTKKAYLEFESEIKNRVSGTVFE
ncbi:MAG: LemA family protein [Candidatus Micrarchaeota archaeon]|nr:LemA family protein [Candidatus Micrarchaeota archaeon]